MHATAAHDDHGRSLTTSLEAADWYQRAQRAAWDHDAASVALRHAVETDPAFTVAIADLDALMSVSTVAGRSIRVTTWERHHLEIVAAATTGESARAASLLREHLSEVGCDPLALRIVHAAVADRDSLSDLLAVRPSCHP